MTDFDKQEFLTGVIHELRAPLNACLMSLNLLEMKAAQPTEVLRCAAVIKRNLDRQALLIQDLADVLQIVSGGLELFVEPVDAAELVAAAIEGCRADAAARGVSLAWTAPPTKLHVSADKDRLSRTVATLVEHQIRVAASGGRVAVALTPAAGNGLELEISRVGPTEGEAAAGGAGDTSALSDRRTLHGFAVRMALAEQVVQAHGGRLDRSADALGFYLPVEAA